MTIPIPVPDHTDNKPSSWLETAAALFLFAFSGLELITNEIPHEYAFPSPFTTIDRIFFLGQFLLYPILLCIGWIKGFPRWSYPYVGQVILFSLYMTQVSTPGFLFGRELWRWRAWIPLLIVCFIALLVTRSLRPLLNFFTNIVEDWTLLTFGMFGCMSLLIGISFDEMDRLFSLYFMVILVILMIVTVILYMRSSTQKKRISTLLVGIFLTVAVTAFGPDWYWSRDINVNAGPGDTIALVIYGIMISPMLLCIRPKRMKPISKKDGHYSIE
ncbi:MAG: hypothetical protein V2J07_10810 [Anaerolineae bacterium]|jgi:hypothetical protein|nr:hypothetical protein [Anaerolineae bacterium]